MTRRVVLSPFYPVSDQLDTSHRAGWARYWANELPAELFPTSRMAEVEDLKRGDTIFVYHGMEFKGNLNLQSGLTEELLARVKRLLDAKKRGVKLVSLDQHMPDYGKLLGDRGMDPTSSDALTKLCRSTGVMWAPTQDPNFLIVGDSHALSQYRPRSVIHRNDGQTLHGALQVGLMTLVDAVRFEWEVALGGRDRFTFYYGNIDIRHHLCRFDDVRAKIKELVAEYEKQLKAVAVSFKPHEIEIVLPLPIEDESRKIPTSGFYKGTGFFGSWHERHGARLWLRDALKRMAKKNGFTVYEHPQHFIGKDGKLTFEVMEKPRSVHIRPSEYRLVQEGMEWVA